VGTDAALLTVACSATEARIIRYAPAPVNSYRCMGTPNKQLVSFPRRRESMLSQRTCGVWREFIQSVATQVGLK
jgi:hypothetical protein